MFYEVLPSAEIHPHFLENHASLGNAHVAARVPLFVKLGSKYWSEWPLYPKRMTLSEIHLGSDRGAGKTTRHFKKCWCNFADGSTYILFRSRIFCKYSCGKQFPAVSSVSFCNDIQGFRNAIQKSPLKVFFFTSEFIVDLIHKKTLLINSAVFKWISAVALME